MGISFTYTFTHRRGGENQLSKAMQISGGSVQDVDINMTSGSAFGNSPGTLGVDDALQNRSGLLALHYETTYGQVTFQHHLSGSYLSGGVSQTFICPSGAALQWLQCSGLPNPLFASGTVTAISAVKPTTMSGVDTIAKARHVYL